MKAFLHIEQIKGGFASNDDDGLNLLSLKSASGFSNGLNMIS